MIVGFDFDKFYDNTLKIMKSLSECLSFLLIFISGVLASFIFAKMGYFVAARQVLVILAFYLLAKFIYFLLSGVKGLVDKKSESESKKKKVKK